jgi:hypothetical protein
LVNAQESLTKMHQHLVDISRHQSAYEQAYLSERQKLLKVVTDYNALAIANERMAQDDKYCKQELLPRYDCLLYNKEQEMQRMRKEIRDSDNKLLEYETNRRAEEEERMIAVETMASLLETRDQKIRELEARVKELKIVRQLPDRVQPPRASKGQRASKCGQNLSTQGHGGRKNECRNCGVNDKNKK